MFEDNFFDEIDEFDEIYDIDYINQQIWKFINNKDLEELKNFIKRLEETKIYLGKKLLHFKAIYSYLNNEKKAKDLIIEVLKENEKIKFRKFYDYEIMLYLVDKLKTFYSKKSILNKLSANIIKNSLKIKEIRFYNEAFEIVCESGFYLIKNNNLNNENKIKLYSILFRFLHTIKYKNLDKESYKKYLQYYFTLLWELRYEFTKLAKEVFSPFIQGVIYKSMLLDSDEDKIAKIMSYGIEEYIAKEILKLIYEIEKNIKFSDEIPF